jgi:peptidoglycan/LPS O-acetylase OafA/YrhL
VKPGLQIPSLDGLRAVSFAIVFAAHAGAHRYVPGAFGVTVFFFLSGYLITTLMRQERERSGRISLSKFYLRRVVRILPPFYIVLGLAVLANLAGLLPGELSGAAVMAQALHYANYWIIAHGFDGVPLGTGVYWSLAVEEHFYLLFPGLYLLLVRLRATPAGQSLALLGLCALLLVWRIYLVNYSGAHEERTGIASDTRFDSLLFGCALALYENPALDRSHLAPAIWKFVLFPLGIIGLLASFLIRDLVFRETLRYTLQGVSLVPIFVCAIRYPDWLPIKPLNWGPLAYVGVLSYSLYLAHQVIIEIVNHVTKGALGQWTLALSALFATLLFSFALYQTVEKPFARLRKKLHA